jgi:hypothetical protein
MEDLKHELAQFIGTEKYYYHAIGHFNYTDGIRYLAEKAQCYWLLDLIGSYQLNVKIRKIPFQLWELKVNKDSSAVATMKEDSDQPVIIKQAIPYSDFPINYIKFYFIDSVLLLPSEY